MTALDIVGVTELAPRLGVAANTPIMWLHRGILPAPDFPSVNGRPAWLWGTIVPWARETGRLK